MRRSCVHCLVGGGRLLPASQATLGKYSGLYGPVTVLPNTPALPSPELFECECQKTVLPSTIRGCPESAANGNSEAPSVSGMTHQLQNTREGCWCEDLLKVFLTGKNAIVFVFCHALQIYTLKPMPQTLTSGSFNCIYRAP